MRAAFLRGGMVLLCRGGLAALWVQITPANSFCPSLNTCANKRLPLYARYGIGSRSRGPLFVVVSTRAAGGPKSSSQTQMLIRKAFQHEEPKHPYSVESV